MADIAKFARLLTKINKKAAVVIKTTRDCATVSENTAKDRLNSTLHAKPIPILLERGPWHVITAADALSFAKKAIKNKNNPAITPNIILSVTTCAPVKFGMTGWITVIDNKTKLVTKIKNIKFIIAVKSMFAPILSLNRSKASSHKIPKISVFPNFLIYIASLQHTILTHLSPKI